MIIIRLIIKRIMWLNGVVWTRSTLFIVDFRMNIKFMIKDFGIFELHPRVRW